VGVVMVGGAIVGEESWWEERYESEGEIWEDD